ncbi:MAG TPA: WYL domain-containing protein [Ruminococcus flavefaciens]|nr:WYL domain-containing protein [Ruminococcus flavefaciens]
MDHERIIHTLDYLSRHTDESHFVTINQIQDYLANVCNLSRVKSVTIRRDLDRLTTMGNNIIKVNHEHNTAYYALIDKGFSFNEIRFIVDSISINKFLTAHQKQKLIKKFEGMCSDTEIRQLISRIVLNERCPSTLDLLENLDKIHRLIGERRKIDFDYGKYNETTKQITYYQKDRDMLPVSVIYFHEKFYLKCFNLTDSKWRIYRVDRMKNISGGDISQFHLPPEEKYEGFVTDMFAPKYFTSVTLRVRKYLLDEMRENFGDFASIIPDNDSDFVRFHVRVGINQKFYLWLMKFGSGVELVAPVKERAEYLEEVRKMLGAYPEFTQQSTP